MSSPSNMKMANISGTWFLGPCSFNGKVQLPGDKSISHRAIILAALAEGTSEIIGLSNGEDVFHTLNAVHSLGTRFQQKKESLFITGSGFSQPRRKIYIGNSGTGIRLLAGICAGQNFETTLDGDKSIRARPMDRVIEPLSLMGADIEAREGGLAPLRIKPADLKGIDYELPVPSAQVKSAILLAGLSAEGKTRVVEKVPTRPHTEEMLKDFGAEITREADNILLQPSQLSAQRVEVAGDPSAAAFWAVGACITEGSRIELANSYTGASRTGYIEVLKRMGADIALEGSSIRVKSSDLAGTKILPAEVPSLIDEIPILAVAAVFAEGETEFLGIKELRLKESNRIESISQAILALGGKAEAGEDSLVVYGTRGFEGGQIDARGDHRIAMAFAIAGLAGNKPVRIRRFRQTVSTSYPNFLTHLKYLRSTRNA